MQCGYKVGFFFVLWKLLSGSVAEEAQARVENNPTRWHMPEVPVRRLPDGVLENEFV